MDPFFPDLRDYDAYYEPFLGGGSVALHITKKYPKLKIIVNDLYEPLYNFWLQLQVNGDYVHTELQQLKSRFPDHGSARGLFEDAKEKLYDLDVTDKDRAVCFYIINKCSFSGLTESSSFSAQASDANFSMRGIDKLPVYSKLIKDWYITNVDYHHLLGDKEKTFVYLDPPYDIKDNLYGRKGSIHKKFDHDDFAKSCEIYNSEMLISYNSDQLVKDRFKDWNCAEFDLTYTMRSVGEYMRNQKMRKELLLFNYNTGVF
jgi:DNA adenine methylase